MSGGLNIVVLGLSITSSWGNGHATTYRALLKALTRRGHAITFLERDVPWYAANRDLPDPPFCRTRLYAGLDDLRAGHAAAVRDADVVVVGSYVPDGVAVGRWVQQTALGLVAFYDIDTPVTLARLARGDAEYLAPDLIPGYGLYLSFTGGPTLDRLERTYGAPLPLIRRRTRRPACGRRECARSRRRAGWHQRCGCGPRAPARPGRSAGRAGAAGCRLFLRPCPWPHPRSDPWRGLH